MLQQLVAEKQERIQKQRDARAKVESDTQQIARSLATQQAHLQGYV